MTRTTRRVVRIVSLRLAAPVFGFACAAATSHAALANDAPVPVAPPLESPCKSGSLALMQLGTTTAAGLATTTFGVRDLGAPCTLPRFAIVRAFDATGASVPLTTDTVRELDVILKVHVRAGAIARFTIVSASTGPACATVANVVYVVGGNRVEAPASFPACTGHGVADPHVSFLMGPPFSGPVMPRIPPGAGASSPAPHP